MNIEDKIREVVNDNDSLVEFKHGKEHCILPEHYEELVKEMKTLFDLYIVNRTFKGLYLWRFEAWVVNNCTMNGESGMYKYLDGLYTKTDLLYKYLEVIKDKP